MQHVNYQGGRDYQQDTTSLPYTTSTLLVWPSSFSFGDFPRPTDSTYLLSTDRPQFIFVTLMTDTGNMLTQVTGYFVGIR